VQEIAVALVKEDAFFEHGLIVCAGDTAAVERTRPLEMPGLDLEDVVAASRLLSNEI